jgi:tight adherence protein B
MSGTDVLVTVTVLGAVFLLSAMVLVYRGSLLAADRSLIRRMAKPATSSSAEIIRVGARRAAQSALFTVLYRINLLRTLEAMMWQAGLYARVSDVLIAVLILFLFGAVAGGAIWADPILALACGVGLGALPLVYIHFRRKRRLDAFILQLPYALDLIKSSLEAGHSLLRGCQVVVAEFADPIGSEFRSVVEQTRLGLPLPRALEEMLRRVPVDDLRLLVVAVKVQAEVGSSLAEIIGRLSEIVRARQRLYQQIRALTAQSRMSGMVVGFLPLVLLGAFSVIQPSYTHTLFYDPTGLMVLKIAAGLDIMAFITIRQLLKVKY